MKYNKKVVESILNHLEHGGTVEGACGAARIAKSTFYLWIDEHPEFADAVEIAKNRAIHRAETKLDSAIESENVQAISFWLRCRADYKPTERREADVSLTGELKHQVNIPSGKSAAGIALEAACNAVAPEYKTEIVNAFKRDLQFGNANGEEYIEALNSLPAEIQEKMDIAGMAAFEAAKALGFPESLPENPELKAIMEKARQERRARHEANLSNLEHPGDDRDGFYGKDASGYFVVKKQADIEFKKNGKSTRYSELVEEADGKVREFNQERYKKGLP